ncbi:hypothetical protein NHL50_06650 [Acidimicrobiia bacterium EGI L10123]|uniref:hypothetical protein n=1 Tax=Salinilacustrithrix flava TaxID=2957203 RepID=UPI003D7C1F4C|nr:hypothetical protein [Acidimicrobiia bacterium EGI L10123]
MANDEQERGPAREQASPSKRYQTWNGEPCPRHVRVDGTVEGSGDCLGCGTCLLGSGLL